MTRGAESTPLTLAAGIDGSTDAVAKLLQRGAKPNSPNKKGDTALIEAARYGKDDVVKLLLTHGASVGMKGAGGLTALAAAADVETADVLISHGADVNDLITVLFRKDAKLDDRQQALSRAAVMGSVQGIAAAVPSPPEIGKRFPNGSTVPLMATMCGRASAVDWLLDHGANPNLGDADCTLPFLL